MAVRGIVEKYCAVAMESWHHNTRTTSKGGMFLLELLQWARLPEWRSLSMGTNPWQGVHQSAPK
jgi:hypothetical protein